MKILLPLDSASCSAAAVDAVVAQFRPADTHVRLLHVVEWPKDLPMHLRMAEGETGASDVLASRDAAYREGEELTVHAETRLRVAGFETSRAVAPGAPCDRILDAAREWEPDLIVVGSHGRRGIDRLLLGSVSEAVIRRAPCSVEVVRMKHLPVA
jgi:nucleotide-binding universal stress UspA family protein